MAPSRALTVCGTSGIFPRMSTLAEIEEAADTLPPDQKQELILFLAARLREGGAQVSPSRSLAERLGPFVGAVHSGAGDLAANHDHYLYGTPKQRP